MNSKPIFLLLFSTCIAISCGVKNAAPLEENIPAIIDATAQHRIDSVLQRFVTKGDIAGISALIYERDKEVYSGVFGMADRENNIPMARSTIVKIASMTKPITGVALMQLFEKGKFKLDDPLSSYVPEFRSTKVF